MTAAFGPMTARIRATVALLFARTALIGFVATAFVLAPSIGHLAIQERDWTARVIMLTLFAGVWCSFYALAAAHDLSRRAGAARRADASGRLRPTARARLGSPVRA